MYGRLQAFYSEQHGPDLGPRKGLWEMQELFCSAPCAAHAAHNAIQWSLGSLTQGEVFHDLHITIESLRNSFSFLQEHIPVSSFPMYLYDSTDRDCAQDQGRPTCD